MKAIWKGFIIGIVFIAIGAGLIVSTLAANDWKIKGPEYEMKTFTAESENTQIEIDIGAGILKTEFYDGDRIEITYPDGKAYKNKFEEQGGTLKFSSKIKWYASFFNLGVTQRHPEMVVKLPAGLRLGLKVEVGAGEVRIASGNYNDITVDVSAGKLEGAQIVCNNLKVDLSAGTVRLSEIDCAGLDADVSAGKLEISSLSCPAIKVDVSAGSVKLGVIGAESEYTVRTSVSAGSCNISNRTGTTDKKLDADVSAGSVTVTFTD